MRSRILLFFFSSIQHCGVLLSPELICLFPGVESPSLFHSSSKISIFKILAILLLCVATFFPSLSVWFYLELPRAVPSGLGGKGARNKGGILGPDIGKMARVTAGNSKTFLYP